jgi:hypothetical protein
MSEINPNFLQLVTQFQKMRQLQDVVDAALRLIGDFDQYGEVMQSNDDGIYDQTTNIEQLRGALIRFAPSSVRSGDYFPHLTEQQHETLKALAVEVIMAADGDEKPNRESVEDDVSTMTPYERLTATGWYDRSTDERANLQKRLGFDPITGYEILH